VTNLRILDNVFSNITQSGATEGSLISFLQKSESGQGMIDIDGVTISGNTVKGRYQLNPDGSDGSLIQKSTFHTALIRFKGWGLVDDLKNISIDSNTFKDLDLLNPELTNWDSTLSGAWIDVTGIDEGIKLAGPMAVTNNTFTRAAGSTAPQSAVFFAGGAGSGSTTITDSQFSVQNNVFDGFDTASTVRLYQVGAVDGRYNTFGTQSASVANNFGLGEETASGSARLYEVSDSYAIPTWYPVLKSTDSAACTATVTAVAPSDAKSAAPVSLDVYQTADSRAETLLQKDISVASGASLDIDLDLDLVRGSHIRLQTTKTATTTDGKSTVAITSMFSRWVEIPSVNCTVPVSFDVQGGSPQLAPLNIVLGDTIPAAAVGAVTRSGYLFDHWAIGSTGGATFVLDTGAAGQSPAPSVVSGAITLYAVWQPNFTIGKTAYGDDRYQNPVADNEIVTAGRAVYWQYTVTGVPGEVVVIRDDQKSTDSGVVCSATIGPAGSGGLGTAGCQWSQPMPLATLQPVPAASPTGP
jgi:hypothetical protein